MQLNEDKIKCIDYNIINKEDEDKVFYTDFFYKDNFIKYNNKIYYLKKCIYSRNMSHILNEIIGEYVSKYFKLDTVHNILIKYGIDMKYGLITKNFVDNRKYYYYFNDTLFVKLNNDSLVGLDNLYNLDLVYDKNYNIIKVDNNCLNIFIKNIKKLIIRDFITKQTDRHSKNMVIKCINDKIFLMPIFDYEHSFYNDDCLAFNHIFDFDLLLDKVCYIVRNDDYFEQLLKYAMNMNINDIINEVEYNYHIKLDKYEVECYNNVVELQKSKIKKYRLIR